jgi:hypothetical protein
MGGERGEGRRRRRRRRRRCRRSWRRGGEFGLAKQAGVVMVTKVTRATKAPSADTYQPGPCLSKPILPPPAPHCICTASTRHLVVLIASTHPLLPLPAIVCPRSCLVNTTRTLSVNNTTHHVSAAHILTDKVRLVKVKDRFLKAKDRVVKIKVGVKVQARVKVKVKVIQKRRLKNTQARTQGLLQGRQRVCKSSLIVYPCRTTDASSLNTR